MWKFIILLGKYSDFCCKKTYQVDVKISFSFENNSFLIKLQMSLIFGKCPQVTDSRFLLESKSSLF